MQVIAELKAGTEYYGIFLLVGVLLASLIVTPNSLPAILVSLERQNFHFLATTPQDIKKYLRLKFQFYLNHSRSANTSYSAWNCIGW